MSAPTRGLAPLTLRTAACRHCGGSDGLRQHAFGGLDVTLCAECAHAADTGRLEYRMSGDGVGKRKGAYLDAVPYGAAALQCSVDGGPWRRARPPRKEIDR